MGKEIGDFAGGLAQGATGGFQQLMQQQMRQRQFEEQREFARTQQASQNAFTLDRDRALNEAKIALFNKRDEAADDRHRDQQQFLLEQKEIEQEAADKRHGESTGLAKQKIAADKDIRLQDVARLKKAAELTAQSRKDAHDLSVKRLDRSEVASEKARLDSRRDTLIQMIRDERLSVDEERKIIRSYNMANNARFMGKVVDAFDPEAFAKFVQTTGGTRKDYDKLTGKLQSVIEMAQSAIFMKPPERVKALGILDSVTVGSQEIHDKAIAEGRTELEALGLAIKEMDRRISEVPELIQNQRKLLADKEEADAAVARGEAEAKAAQDDAEKEQAAADAADPAKRRLAKRDEKLKSLLKRREQRKVENAEDERRLIQFLRDRSAGGAPNIPVGGKF